MAAASDDEEMNYWPGFVDALSTMTMMLIFLMLILSLVIVSVSQNVSRAQVLAIAKAAKVDTSGSPASIENLTAQIISALSQLSQNQKQRTPVTGTDPKEITTIVEPSTKLRIAEKENLAIYEGNKVASQGLDDAGISTGKSSDSRVSVGVDPARTRSENPSKSSQTAPLEPLSGGNAFAELQRQPSATRILSDTKAELAPFGGEIDMRLEQSMITLIFPPRSLTPNEVMMEKFFDVIRANGQESHRVASEISAIANTNSGQVTEARRLAYYLAMFARQMLIDQKIDPKNNRVTVVDEPTEQDADYVRISIKPL